MGASVRIAKALARGLNRAVVAVAIVVALAVIAVLLLTQTDTGRAIVAKQLINILNDSVFAGNLEVEELGGRLFDGATLRGVSLTADHGTELARLASAEIEYELWPLREQRVVIERIVLDGLVVSGTILQDGSLDLSGALAESESAPTDGPAWSVDISEIVLTNGRFVLRDARNEGARVVRAEHISLSAGFVLDSAGAIGVDVAELQLDFASPMDLDRLTAVTLRETNITVAGSALGLRVGAVAFADTEVQDLSADVTLAEADDAAPFAYIDVTLPEFVLQPADANLWLGQDVLLAPLTVAATLEGPASAVQLSLPVSGPEGSVGATLELDLTTPATPGYSGLIRLVRLQPGEWLDLGTLDADVSAGIYVEGRGITPAELELALRVDLGPSRVGQIAVDEAYLSLAYADETVTLRDLEIRSRGATVDCSGSVARSGAVSLDLRVDAPDLAALQELNAAVPAVSGALRVAVTVEGNAPLEAWAAGDQPTTLDELRAALGPLEATLELAGRDLQFEAYAAERIDVQATLAGSATEPEVDVTLSTRGLVAADVVVASANANIDWRGDQLTTELQASMPGIVDNVALRANSRLDDERIVSRFSRLLVERDGVRVETTAPMSVTVEHDAFSLTRTIVEGVQLDFLGGRVLASGSYQLADEGFTIALSLEDASLRELAALASLEPSVDGQLTARLDASGTLRSPRFDLTAALEGGRGFGIENIAVSTRAQYAGSLLSAELQLAHEGEQRLSIEGLQLPLSLNLSNGRVALLEADTWAARLVFTALEIGMAEALVPSVAELAADGRLDGTIDVSGTPSAPSAVIAAELAAFRMNLPMQGQPDLSIRDVGATLNGTVESVTADEARVDLRLDLSSAGSERANATLRGEIDVSQIRDGTYDLQSQRFRASASATRVLISELPEFVREQVPADSGWIELSAIWNGALAEPTAKANLTVGDVMIESFGPFSVNAIVMAGDTVSVAGRVTSSGESTPLVDVSAALSQSLRDFMTDGLSMIAGINATAAVAPLALTLFAPLEPALAESDGEFELRFSLGGSLAAPELEGFAALRDLRLVSGSRGSLRVDAAYSGFETRVNASVTADEVVLGTADLTVSTPPAIEAGELVLSPWREWPITADVQADDTPLALLLPTIAFGSLLESVDGIANIALDATGTLGVPVLGGSIELHDAAASVIPLQRRFERIGLLARFSGSSVTLEELRVGDADGRATASGQLTLEGLLPQEYELEVRFRDLFVADANGTGVNLRGDVLVNGIFSEADHQTNVLIDDMRVTLPDDTSASSAGPTSLPDSILFVGEDVTVAHVGERNPPRIGASEAAGAIELPWVISIITTGQNEVRHPYVTAEFEIDILARIIDGEVSATGAVTVPDGEIRVAGNSFDIVRGVIRLPEGARELDPLVDIEAVHVLPPGVTEVLSAAIGPPSGDEATIRLRVTGALSQLQADPGAAVELYSDPAMEERDIFMVLATGRLSGDGDAAEAEQGFEALSNLLAGVLSDRISRGLFIDTLNFETTSESQRVEGGKYIADNLYVSGTYIRTPGETDDNNFEVALQWILRQIGPGTLRVELRGGDRAKGGLELLYQVVRRARSRTEGGGSETVPD